TDERLWFTPEQRQELIGVFGQLEQACRLMLQNLEAEQGAPLLDEAALAVQKIRRQCERLQLALIQPRGSGEQDVRAGLVFSDLLNGSTRLAGHLLNVSRAFAEP